jgi:hypothetical protein
MPVQVDRSEPLLTFGRETLPDSSLAPLRLGSVRLEHGADPSRSKAADRLSDAIAEHQCAIRLPLARRIEAEPLENSPEAKCCNRDLRRLAAFRGWASYVIV